MTLCPACGKRFEARAEGQIMCSVRCSVLHVRSVASPLEPTEAPQPVREALRRTRASVRRMLPPGRPS